MSALGRAWVAAQRNASKKVTVMTGNWEVLSSDIDHNNCVPIGEGSFGPVYQTTIAKVSGKAVPQSVVIKKLLDNGDAGAKRRFIREMQAMKEVENEHICKMIGVVTVEPPLLMVFECGTGLNLKTFLVANRSMAPLTVSAQIQMSFQIAQAMNFLAERNVVHQDLVWQCVPVSAYSSPATGHAKLHIH
jgi:serine/threonine protein kinase